MRHSKALLFSLILMAFKSAHPEIEYGPAKYYVAKGSRFPIISFQQDIGVKEDEFFFGTPYVLVDGLPIECLKCTDRVASVVVKKGKITGYCDKHHPNKEDNSMFTRLCCKSESKETKQVKEVKK